MTETKIFAEWLKKARKNAGKISQQGLADAAGLSKESIRMYETGERGPSDDNMPQLAHALGVTEEELAQVVESYRAERERLSKMKEVDASRNAGIVIRDEKSGVVWFSVEFPPYLIVSNAMELIVRTEADFNQGHMNGNGS